MTYSIGPFNGLDIILPFGQFRPLNVIRIYIISGVF